MWDVGGNSKQEPIRDSRVLLLASSMVSHRDVPESQLLEQLTDAEKTPNLREDVRLCALAAARWASKRKGFAFGRAPFSRPCLETSVSS